MKEKLAAWLKENIVAVIFSLLFIMVYIAKAFHPEVNDLLGVCSLKFMNGEYYRWFTCSFLHYGLYHLFGNIIGLLAVSSLISPLIGKWKMVFFFFASDVIGGIIFSWIVSSSSPDYGGGASGGIFALIAVLLVCYLRFPEQFKIKWYRIDVLAVVVYVIAANDNWASVLTHIFGFTFGTIWSFIFVVLKLIKKSKNQVCIENKA